MTACYIPTFPPSYAPSGFNRGSWFVPAVEDAAGNRVPVPGARPTHCRKGALLAAAAFIAASR